MAHIHPAGTAGHASTLQPVKPPPGAPRSLLTRRNAWIGSSAAVLVTLAAYRVFTFVPRPLDAPRTLRPILYALFYHFVHLFQTPDDAQRFWHSGCILLLLVPPILAVWNYLYGASAGASLGRLHRFLSSHLLFFFSIGVALAVCRFPALLAGEISPDETLFIAAAE